ncbi:MAG: GDP-mannose 4,6-dehydratase, partial [Lysinibacillus sp.]
MKVLITGGYGFIGSHVADQFYKEGYEVHILDNLSSGKKENIQFKHKSYILSVDDPKCSDIFKSYQFDTVVHLAAQVSVSKSVLNPSIDAQTNLVGLTNILQLAIANDVKKFIFTSTAAVYGDNDNVPLNERELPKPISPYGISKWAGETYCHNLTENLELETICFRLSNVYGPRQTDEGEGGVIAVYTSKLVNNQPLIVHGDGNQTRDFIYVEDVAFAIYEASQSNLCGTYNLSTNTEVSIQEIIKAFEQIHGKVEKNYSEARPADIYRSSLDNSAIKAALDWSPKYSLSNGLQKTYDWAKLTQQLEQEKTIPSSTTTQPPPSQSDDELPFHIQNHEDSFAKIYSIIKELDDLEPEKIFTNTVKVVQKIMHCQNVSIYALNKQHSFLRLVAHSETSDSSTLQNSIKVEDSPYIQDLLNNRKIYVNRQSTAELPLMAAPIFYNNEIRAVITI